MYLIISYSSFKYNPMYMFTVIMNPCFSSSHDRLATLCYKYLWCVYFLLGWTLILTCHENAVNERARHRRVCFRLCHHYLTICRVKQLNKLNAVTSEWRRLGVSHSERITLWQDRHLTARTLSSLMKCKRKRGKIKRKREWWGRAHGRDDGCCH